MCVKLPYYATLELSVKTSIPLAAHYEANWDNVFSELTLPDCAKFGGKYISA